MSGQFESHHFFRVGDVVSGVDGRLGTVIQSGALFAMILWDSGDELEVDQFDPTILVVQRASPE